MRWQGYLVMDVLLVVVFAAIGRRSHAEASDVLGLVATAAPFLAGLLAGWAYTAARNYRPLTVRQALPLWLLTVAVGHLVRILVGTGTAVSFVVVSLVALGVLLLLPRAILDRTRR